MDLAFEACSKSTAELVVYEGLAATLDLKPKESESTARLGFPVVGIYQIALIPPSPNRDSGASSPRVWDRSLDRSRRADRSVPDASAIKLETT